MRVRNYCVTCEATRRKGDVVSERTAGTESIAKTISERKMPTTAT